MTSHDAGKIYHLSGCSSLLGHLSSKLMAQLKDCSFRSPLLMEALKLQLSLCTSGTAWSGVSFFPYKRHICFWLGGNCFTLVVPFSSPVTAVGSADPLFPPTAITFSLTRRQAIWKGTTLNFMGGHSYKDIAVLEDVHWYRQSVLRHSGNHRGT